MSFPDTSKALIQRIVSRGSDADWTRFLHDYWGPGCRFGRRWSNLDLADAEDAASSTFLVVVENNLLRRWADDPASGRFVAAGHRAAVVGIDGLAQVVVALMFDQHFDRPKAHHQHHSQHAFLHIVQTRPLGRLLPDKLFQPPTAIPTTVTPQAGSVTPY